MNVAAKALLGNKLVLDGSREVNEPAAIVLNAKRDGGKRGISEKKKRSIEDSEALTDENAYGK
jgi:hypothetical protein